VLGNKETAPMPTILSDHDIEGQVERIVSIWTSPSWSEVWQTLNCRVETFKSLGLRTTLPDLEVWQFCQEQGMVLLTGNRNAVGEDSLERASQRLNQPNSLPILTIADSQRVLLDREYAERVASQIIDYILILDRIRGARRLFVP
jgi:hypothetical protein